MLFESWGWGGVGGDVGTFMCVSEVVCVHSLSLSRSRALSLYVCMCVYISELFCLDSRALSPSFPPPSPTATLSPSPQPFSLSVSVSLPYLSPSCPPCHACQRAHWQTCICLYHTYVFMYINRYLCVCVFVCVCACVCDRLADWHPGRSWRGVDLEKLSLQWSSLS